MQYFTKEESDRKKIDRASPMLNQQSRTSRNARTRWPVSADTAVGLVICRAVLHEPPNDCYELLAHAKFALSSGLGAARGLLPLLRAKVDL